MKPSQSPAVTRFLSDFTLGFSDGLTVPFALTAGLSSLGSTDTVISGGLAELCAGSISMGIGGYLAARDEVPPPRKEADVDDEEGMRGMLSYSSSSSEFTEKRSNRAQELVLEHFELLHLPDTVTSQILEALQEIPGSLERAATRLQFHNDNLHAATSEDVAISPIVSGLSISLGYAIGGIIPLFPYFFAATVGAGFRWSLCLCLVALFAFGSGKSFALRSGSGRWRCVSDGLQMLVLGMMAAGAAITCVMLVEGKMGDQGS